MLPRRESVLIEHFLNSIKKGLFMLIEECKGCKYLKNIVALGLGVRCNHPDRQPKKGLIPVISTIENCELKELVLSCVNDSMKPIEPIESDSLDENEVKYNRDEIMSELRELEQRLKDADPNEMDLVDAMLIDSKIGMLTEILDEMEELNDK